MLGPDLRGVGLDILVAICMALHTWGGEDLIWEWASITPGVTHLPWPSITCHPTGTVTSLPAALILLFSTNTVPPSNRCPSPSKILAPTIAKGAAVAGR
jgi:hypothetical protein